MRLGVNSKSIEQSVQSYYLATGTIESTLQNAGTNLKKSPWKITWKTKTTPRWYSGSYLDIKSLDKQIPSAWFGNSPFDNNYNLISMDKPVQVVIPNGINWDEVKIEIRLPKTIKGTNGVMKSPSIKSGISSTDVILWTIGNTKKVLYAKWTGVIKIGDINKPAFSLGSKMWIFYKQASWKVVPFEKTLKEFYISSDGLETSWRQCANYTCTLKLSMLRPVETVNNGPFPFLEYKINLRQIIPNQYMVIDSTGYVGDYQRSRRIFIPQITTNTALDFAVLQ